MSTSDTVVLCAVDDRAATLTLNRPKRVNAIDAARPAALRAAVEPADADPKVHVIVLQGAGLDGCEDSD